MQALAITDLARIALAHNILYDTPGSSFPFGIATTMSRVYKVPKGDLYKRIADLKGHTQLFSHLSAINVVDSASVANVIGPNQYVIVEGIAEGGSKLGVKLVTLLEDEIRCELFTDLFKTAAFQGRKSDPKAGAITWKFQEVSPNETKLSISSDFQVSDQTQYVRGSIDHVWVDFFENLMVEAGELTPATKMAQPFALKPASTP